MQTNFEINSKTVVTYTGKQLESIDYFINILKRDLIFSLSESFDDRNVQTTIDIVLDEDNSLLEEQYSLTFEENKLIIHGSDELAIIYGILHISREFLKINNFWFWNDLLPEKQEKIIIKPNNFLSKKSKVKYRGWFINDEVLISKWKVNQSNEEVWEKTFETLLRCNGNMVIPGTDIDNPIYKNIAAKMGLWITHHHAEPLGAKMFAREFPGEEASYVKNKELFRSLWSDAIESQKDNKIIWNLGFRGQGDKPFWVDDPSFETDEERGKLIGDIINEQYELIKKVEENPACCVNLYGEITELFRKGHLQLPDDVIKVWADSGYGKMVSRRQGNHNPRIISIPEEKDGKQHGTYYHVTFYDLQASNHLTMLPNTFDFVKDELSNSFEHNMTDFLIVNCGNVRPHTIYLELVSQIWTNDDFDLTSFMSNYFTNIFPENGEEVLKLFTDYQAAIINYGNYSDERAGEQLYYHTIRQLAYSMVEGNEKGVQNLFWLTGEKSLSEQLEFIRQLLLEKLPLWEKLSMNLEKLLPNELNQMNEEEKRIRDLFGIQVVLHLNGLKSLLQLINSYQNWLAEDYFNSFLSMNESKEYLEKTVNELNSATSEKWLEFYDNDCLTNVSLSLDVVSSLIGIIRIKGDGPNLYKWEKQYLQTEGERSVVLLTNKTKQLTNQELYLSLKKRQK